MFQLEQEVLELYNSLPRWAQEDLSGRGACWQYSGNEVLGWHWTADSKDYKRLNFGLNPEIPSNPLVYLDAIHELLYRTHESYQVDFTHDNVDNHYCFKILKHETNNDVAAIEGYGSTKLIASIHLYLNACKYYVETEMPSVTSLDCVDNLFTDIDGVPALNMTTAYAASVLFSSYSRFVLTDYNQTVMAMSSGMEEQHGVIKFVEGDTRVYSNYGVKEKPAIKKDRFAVHGITTAVGHSTFVGGGYNNAITSSSAASYTFNSSGYHLAGSGGPNFYSGPLGVTYQDPNSGVTYNILGTPDAKQLAPVVWDRKKWIFKDEA